jgi:hypothetical protein
MPKSSHRTVVAKLSILLLLLLSMSVVALSFFNKPKEITPNRMYSIMKSNWNTPKEATIVLGENLQNLSLQ